MYFSFNIDDKPDLATGSLEYNNDFEIEGKPTQRTLSFSVPANPLIPATMLGLVFLILAPVVANGQRGIGITRDTSPFKGFSGLRFREDSTRLVYYYEQTVAVVEIGPRRELYNCELIEVYKPAELKATLLNLTSISEPTLLTFEQMIDLMKLCEQVATPQLASRHIKPRGTPNMNPVTLLRGILPGTKWCGAGDLADTYFDLGEDSNLDKCCRTHDLCPIKVKAYASRYNLTNKSLYTKSHCTCDLILHECLKNSSNPTADIMGNIYFNLLRVPCLRISRERTVYQPAVRY